MGTYRFFDLSLEHLELRLKLVDEFGETFLVLPVFLQLELDLLDATFGLSPVLVSVLVAPERKTV